VSLALKRLACRGSLILLALSGGMAAAADDPDSGITPFSTALPGAPLPPPWRIATLPKPMRATQYALVVDEGTVVLRAEANASMASVMHALRIDPRKNQFISWRWKIGSVLHKSDIRMKAGDDFPARVYVLFDYDASRLSILQRAKIFLARKLYGKDVPAAALCYVWDGKAAIGTSAWSPYTDRVRVIVVESGTANVNRWQEEERDIVADFRAAFSEDPPAISGVAVASDTDNTGESVVTLFGDIRLSPRRRNAQ
jgi:hypothetical protein